MVECTLASNPRKNPTKILTPKHIRKLIENVLLLGRQGRGKEKKNSIEKLKTWLNKFLEDESFYRRGIKEENI